MYERTKIYRRKEIRFRSCFVPECQNTTVNSPDKLFIPVPRKQENRNRWVIAVGRVPPIYGLFYCCEDHFNVKDDIIYFPKLTTKNAILPYLNLKESQSDVATKSPKVISVDIKDIPTDGGRVEALQCPGYNIFDTFIKEEPQGGDAQDIDTDVDNRPITPKTAQIFETANCITKHEIIIPDEKFKTDDFKTEELQRAWDGPDNNELMPSEYANNNIVKAEVHSENGTSNKTGGLELSAYVYPVVSASAPFPEGNLGRGLEIRSERLASYKTAVSNELKQTQYKKKKFIIKEVVQSENEMYSVTTFLEVCTDVSSVVPGSVSLPEARDVEVQANEDLQKISCGATNKKLMPSQCKNRNFVKEGALHSESGISDETSDVKPCPEGCPAMSESASLTKGDVSANTSIETSSKGQSGQSGKRHLASSFTEKVLKHKYHMKPIKCRFCDDWFACSKLLRSHRRSMHGKAQSQGNTALMRYFL